MRNVCHGECHIEITRNPFVGDIVSVFVSYSVKEPLGDDVVQSEM